MTPQPAKGEVVPFGKYKGQPVEVLRADDDYCDWLMGQGWFRSKFPTVYQTIINYGGEPQETPEHNELQASFLNDERCFRLARLLYPSSKFDDRKIARQGTSALVNLCNRFRDHLTESHEGPAVVGRQFESSGWDVVYSIKPVTLTMNLVSAPPCVCLPCDHSSCQENAPCNGGEHKWGCYHDKHETTRLIPSPEWVDDPPRWEWENSRAHCSKTCPWRDEHVAKWLLGADEEVRWFQRGTVGTIRVECKPDLGDDFPAVLRQVASYKHDLRDRRCVIVRRASFEKVTWEQVEAIFAASRIVLLREDRLKESGA